MEKIIKRRLSINTFLKILGLIPDFIAYLASIVTIIYVYYNKSGKLNFNINNIIDWIIVIISIYVLIIGIVNIISKSKYNNK
jgi:hypothetical protein